MPYILCIDLQNKLEAILSELAPVFGFTYDLVDSEKEFLTKLAKGAYTSLLIVEEKKTGDLFTLLSKCAHQKPLSVCTLVDQSKNAKAYRSLKAELKIDFVLELPVMKEELAAVLRVLSGLEKKNESGEIDGLPDELVEKYRMTIFDKIEAIEEQIVQIEEAYGVKEPLVALRNTVHKIAGSAGAYGFGEAGRLCKAQELFLYDIYNAETLTLTKKEIDESNQRFLRLLKLAFQNIILRQESTLVKKKGYQQKGEQKHPTKLMPVFLSLVSTDLSLVRLFQKIASERQLSLEVESDPKVCLQKWSSAHVHPNALIVEEYFPFTSYTGLEVIHSLKEKWKDVTVSFGLLTLIDDLEKRMQWLTQGVEYILKKPLTEDNISSIFDQISTKRHLKQIKALIIEDDEDVGAIEMTALEQLGMSVYYLQDETRLLRTLEEVDPDLILLDINLPRYNGRELLQTLRSDIRFSNLIIVIVTVVTGEEFDQWAYAAKCDEIVHKPIDIPMLQARILNLVQRHTSLQSKTRLDPTTGLYPKDYFYAKVNDLFARSIGIHAAFTIIKLDFWDNLCSLLAPLELKDLLIQIAETVKSYFIKRSLVGYLDNGSFGLLFLNLLGGEIEFVINAFYTEVKKKILIAGRANIKITLSSATSLFAVGKLSISIVIGETEKALQKLQEEGSSHTIVKRLTPYIAEIERKHIILVDDDKDLCEVVVYAFQNHGFVVDQFHSGEEAINYIAKLEKLEGDTLVILDRILPDLDGLTLLRLIQEKFPGKIKAMFLSSLSTEKDILEGLKLGALDYITKPFSISILLQKALLLLNQ